ncbi:MAG: hypothetical protein A2177_04105 [Spirochaetes bacterium RBG_13_68_11]|nr:MAG: hypothetical protein A2177_04105 [Spirochaetes bacterium RBG_13_68_11]
MIETPLRDLTGPIAPQLAAVAALIRGSAGPGAAAEGFGAPLDCYLRESVGHLFRTPGKLLRPTLVLCSAAIAGAGGRRDDEGVVSLAAAVELLHTASLAHDDILDEEETRRGQRSLNRSHGNRVAVLVGDVLYARFFSLLTEIRMPDPARAGELFALFARTTERMCLAEICDERLRRDGRAPTAPEYLRIVEYKTAELMSACCRAAALLQGAAGGVADALGAFGRSFGLAYQLADDAEDRDAPPGVPLDLRAAEREHAAAAGAALGSLPAGPHRRLLEQLCGLLAPGVSS